MVIQLKPLRESNIVLVGAHSYPLAVAKRLASKGIGELVLIDTDEQLAAAKRVLLEVAPKVNIVEYPGDPANIIAANPGCFTSSGLVIATDQPRSIEEMLGNLLWNHDAADVPLLISRKVAYNVKMRAQYREWIGKTGMSIKGSDLQGRPKDPWTKAKSSLLMGILSSAAAETWPANYVAGAAAAEAFHLLQPSPAPGDPAALNGSTARGLAQAAFDNLCRDRLWLSEDGILSAKDVLEIMLSGGYGASTVTTDVMSTLLAWDAEALVTGESCPLNGCSVEKVYQLGLRSLDEAGKTD